MIAFELCGDFRYVMRCWCWFLDGVGLSMAFRCIVVKRAEEQENLMVCGVWKETFRYQSYHDGDLDVTARDSSDMDDSISQQFPHSETIIGKSSVQGCLNIKSSCHLSKSMNRPGTHSALVHRQ